MSPADKWFCIVNPHAGAGRCGKLAPRRLERIRSAGLNPEVRHTRAPGDATAFAREAWAQGYRKFISMGGDGTSFEIINGLFPAAGEEAPVLAAIPLGTGNSFLRDFGPADDGWALRALLTGREQPVDVIETQHDKGTLHFINIFSIGFVADVGDLTNKRFKFLGEAGYVAGVVSCVASLHPRPLPFTVDGGALDSAPLTFLSINNSRFTGGKMMMAPNANPSDGTFDVIRAGAMERMSLLATFPKIFRGTHFSNPALSQQQAKEIRFMIQDPLPAMVDGEVVTLRPLGMKVLPAALHIRVA
ncbi:MAG: Diacylglycerol kinase [Myxococcota bacterium]|nr:Diacylglycerol kinase [Myxococcota bacterium]